MAELKNIAIKDIEQNKGQIDGLPQNPRYIKDNRYKALKKSIEDAPEMLDYRRLLVIEYNNKFVTIAGNMRLVACKEIGYSEMPCYVLPKDTPPEKLREYAIKDNIGFGNDDWDILANEWDADELIDWGYEMPTYWGVGEDENEDGEAAVVEDEIPEVVETRCKKGDVWQLGRHRLMCGDSTNKEDIALLMDGGKADLLLTDPPYGIKADKGFSGAEGFGGKGKLIERRHYKDTWDNSRPEKDVFDYICLQAEKAIIFGGNFFTDELPVGNHWLVWNKHNTMPTFSDGELAWTNIKRNSVKIYDIEYNGLIGKEKERFHPTQKPVKLFADILKDYTEEENIICDFYGGSGSTLIACEQLNRTCYMCELDAHYCDVIIARWEKLTGKTAEKIN